MKQEKAPRAQGSSPRVLIVEDEGLIAADLEATISAMGYKVCGVAATAETALELTKNHRPDLVLMDIVLLGAVDGIEAAESIKSQWDIPVVFLTSYADTDTLRRAKLSFPFGYVMKPFEKRHLEITVEMALYVARVDADRRRATEELRSSEEKYRILLDESIDPIFAFYPHGEYRYVNRAFAQGVGRAAQEIIGKTIWDIFPKEEADKRFAALTDAFETGEIKVIEVRVPLSTGDRYYITTINPIKNEHGNVISAICSSKEITDRKKAESERERLINDLQQALEEIKTLRGFIPICAKCKKIRDDAGFWQQVEEYVQDRTHAQFTHSICPQCIEELYPSLSGRMRKKDEAP